ASVAVLASLWFAHLFQGAFIRRFADRIGFRELGDVASFPLLLLLMSLFSLAVMPVTLAYTRHREHEADRFALEITRANHSLATAFVKLQRDNLAVPRPGALFTLWRASHPPIGERIDFCNTYRPWLTG